MYLHLKLEQTKDGIDLIAVDEFGDEECGYILRITNTGKMFKFSGLNPELGFKLNKDEQIKSKKEDW